METLIYIHVPFCVKEALKQRRESLTHRVINGQAPKLEAPPKRPKAWGFRISKKEVRKENPEPIIFEQTGRRPGQMTEYG